MAGAESKTKRFAFRLCVWTVLLAAAGAGGIYGVDQLLIKPRQAEQRRLQEEVERQRQEIETLRRRKKQLEDFVARLKYSERRAQVVVLDQTKDPNGLVTTRFRFTEINAEGNPVSKSQDFTVLGDEVYFDRLVIKFEDHFIEHGDALKGKALMLFRRVFTNKLKPEDGYPLDPRGMAPEIYAAKEAPSDFEKDLWARFWKIADNPEEAGREGIRAIHGDAVYQRLKKDRVYLIELRASGELTIRPALARPKKRIP